MEKALREEFEQFCKDMGQSKTDATEKAILMFMKTVVKMPSVVLGVRRHISKYLQHIRHYKEGLLWIFVMN